MVIKKIFSLLLVILTLVSCKKEENQVVEFVDKRFNEVLLPYARGSWYTKLSPDGIYFYDDEKETHKNYVDCKLLKNSIGYVKFICGDIYLPGEPRSRFYRKTYVYHFDKENFSGTCYLVRERFYVDHGGASRGYLCYPIGKKDDKK